MCCGKRGDGGAAQADVVSPVLTRGARSDRHPLASGYPAADGHSWLRRGEPALPDAGHTMRIMGRFGARDSCPPSDRVGLTLRRRVAGLLPFGQSDPQGEHSSTDASVVVLRVGLGTLVLAGLAFLTTCTQRPRIQLRETLVRRLPYKGTGRYEGWGAGGRDADPIPTLTLAWAERLGNHGRSQQPEGG